MDRFHSKPRLLVLIQVDSITGENVGDAIHSLYEAGSKNVQVISTITKKNRPGYIFLIDCDATSVSRVEKTAIAELGITGWHVINSEHRYIPVNVEEKNIKVCCGEKVFLFRVQRKVSSAEPDIIRPEFECCAQLKRRIKEEFGLSVSLRWASAKITEVFAENVNYILVDEGDMRYEYRIES